MPGPGDLAGAISEASTLLGHFAERPEARCLRFLAWMEGQGFKRFLARCELRGCLDDVKPVPARVFLFSASLAVLPPSRPRRRPFLPSIRMEQSALASQSTEFLIQSL